MDTFDPESGLVYRETIVKSRRKSKREPDWEHKCQPYRAPLWPGGRAKSLENLALEKIVQNASSLTSRALQAVPPHLVTLIWSVIRDRRRESFHVWKTFVESGHTEEDDYFEFSHRTHLPQASWREPLVDYFSKISSASMAWMTDIDLFDVSCSAAELKQLKTVVNIRKLRICYCASNNQSVLDDKMIEHWALCATNRTAFQFLETILVLNAPGVSSDSLQLLNNFPLLKMVRLYGTTVKHRHSNLATQCGWSLQLDSRLLNNLKLRQDKGVYPELESRRVIYEYLYRHCDPSLWDYDERHILSVKFSGGVSGTLYPSEVQHILLLERMLDSKGIAARDSATKDSATKDSATKDNQSPSITITNEAPANKKRKLREGKSLQLDALFDSF